MSPSSVTPWEAGDDDDLALVEFVVDFFGVEVLRDAGLGEVGVGDHADLAAGETDGGVSLGVEGHGDKGDGDLFARREELVHLALGRGDFAADPSLARSMSSSVVCPMAETTTATCLPASLAATIFLAALWIFSAVATEVPPNFCTTMPMGVGFRRNCLGTRGSNLADFWGESNVGMDGAGKRRREGGATVGCVIHLRELSRQRI